MSKTIYVYIYTSKAVHETGTRPPNHGYTCGCSVARIANQYLKIQRVWSISGPTKCTVVTRTKVWLSPRGLCDPQLFVRQPLLVFYKYMISCHQLAHRE